MFTGTTALSLDGKGRITVPSKHRDALKAISERMMLDPSSAWLPVAAAVARVGADAGQVRRDEGSGPTGRAADAPDAGVGRRGGSRCRWARCRSRPTCVARPASAVA
ncbi:MAG: hypothetical protein R3E48_07350 [Burkholderiaceae bacterium]